MDDLRVSSDMPPEELFQLLALYDGEILYTDPYIGQMLDALDLYGVAEKTLVVVVGDHGEEFFDHQQKGHRRTLYDEQLLVPLIMRLPKTLPAGRRVAMQVRMVDIASTILDLTGAAPLERSSGESLLPFILGEKGEADLPAMSYLSADSILLRTLRGSGQKIQVSMPFDMVRREYRGRVELFDLVADPRELHSQVEGTQVEAALVDFQAAFAKEETLRKQVSSGAGIKIRVPAAVARALEELGYLEAGSP